MDEIVKAALKKWPNVPHCLGWLALDARGDWYMRDDRVQAAGPFPRVKGSRIEHDKLREFIGRNYEHDDSGCWFFQNGPQRVYVELETTPWIWRLQRGENGAVTVSSHTGRAALPRQAWLDAEGRLYLDTDIGIGLVHSVDMGIAAEAVERGLWPPREIDVATISERFGFVRSPQAAHATGST